MTSLAAFMPASGTRPARVSLASRLRARGADRDARGSSALDGAQRHLDATSPAAILATSLPRF